MVGEAYIQRGMSAVDVRSKREGRKSVVNRQMYCNEHGGGGETVADERSATVRTRGLLEWACENPCQRLHERNASDPTVAEAVSGCGLYVNSLIAMSSARRIG